MINKSELKEYGYDSKLGFRQIGFMVNNLGSSQKNYLMIKNINSFVEVNPYIDICVFTQDIGLPCVTPNFPIFHQTQIVPFTGTLISSDFQSLVDSYKSARANKIYYAYDLEWKQEYHGEWNVKQERFLEVLSTEDLLVVTRSSEYLDEINNLSTVNCEDIVDDFDILGFNSLINKYFPVSKKVVLE